MTGEPYVWGSRSAHKSCSFKKKKDETEPQSWIRRFVGKSQGLERSAQRDRARSASPQWRTDFSQCDNICGLIFVYWDDKRRKGSNFILDILF